MTPAFRFIATAWTFFWRQPALQRAAFVLVFLPMLAMGMLDATVDVDRPEQAAILVVLYLGLLAILTWGIACTLTVGRRLLQAKAGRLRTSFKAVRGHSAGFVASLILTDVLRACITILWALPAMLLAFIAMAILDPVGIVRDPFVDSTPYLFLAGVCMLLILPVGYIILTSLAPHIVAYEKIGFRQALARSIQLTKAHVGSTLLITAVISLLWLPGLASDVLFSLYAPAHIALVAAPIVGATIDTVALVLWLLSLTLFYKALGGKTKVSADDE